MEILLEPDQFWAKIDGSSPVARRHIWMSSKAGLERPLCHHHEGGARPGKRVSHHIGRPCSVCVAVLGAARQFGWLGVSKRVRRSVDQTRIDECARGVPCGSCVSLEDSLRKKRSKWLADSKAPSVVESASL